MSSPSLFKRAWVNRWWLVRMAISVVIMSPFLIVEKLLVTWPAAITDWLQDTWTWLFQNTFMSTMADALGKWVGAPEKVD